MYKNDWRFHNMRRFNVYQTRGRHLAMWERGGVTSIGGTATLLATPAGRKPKAMAVTMYDNTNGKHALVQVNKGTIIAWGKVEYGEVNIQLYVVKKLHYCDSYIEAKRVNECYHGDWEYPLDERFESVVEALQQKLKMKGCTVPVYVRLTAKRIASLKPKAKEKPSE